MEQLFLQAVTAEIQRTGVEETVFEQVYAQLKTLCTFDGKQQVIITKSVLEHEFVLNGLMNKCLE